MSLRLTRGAALIRAALSGILALGLSACVSVYRDHGYMPPDDVVSGIRLGVDTRETIAQTVGTPGATGVLNSGGYYYVASRIRHFGAREPQVVSRELLAISFDARGIARNIERFGLERGRVVQLEQRITDAGATDKTFLRQLVGNLGRINPGS